MSEPTIENIPAPTEREQKLLDLVEAQRVNFEREVEGFQALHDEHTRLLEAQSDFLIETVMEMTWRATHDLPEDEETAEIVHQTMKTLLGSFINNMPTPKMLAMQETITNTLQNNTRLSAERSVLAEALREEGVDPDAVIARKEQEAAAFLETLREAGLDNTGVPYDINPVEESVADDTPDTPLE